MTTSGAKCHSAPSPAAFIVKPGIISPNRNCKLRLPLRRLCGCSTVLLEEAIHGGDSLIDLIIEEIQERGFASSRARATVLASFAQWHSIECTHTSASGSCVARVPSVTAPSLFATACERVFFQSM